MKHRKSIRIFGREKGQREALIKSLASSLIIRGKIKTTEAKAKSLRPFVEKLITKSKHDTLSSRRLLESRLGSKSLAIQLVEKVGPKYKERNGGYTRITKLPPRMSDSAKMAQIELI